MDLSFEEEHAIERALDFEVWRLCDDLEGTLSALKKLDPKAARRAVNEVCEKVAAVAADLIEEETNGD